MITLITGTPGAGKTLYTLRFLMSCFYVYSFYEKILIFFGLLEKKIFTSNSIYCHGITGLSLPHEIVICDSETCDFCRSLPKDKAYKKVKDWRQYSESGSVFFIDECQHIYRNKSSISVSEFETHRHKGIDFYLITQHPMLINSDLRKLVGKHIHLVADFLGRKQYEWSECSQALSTTKAVRSSYRLDKSLYALYQSSELHTKVSRKVPFIVYVMIAALVIGLYSVYKAKKRFAPPPVTQSHSSAASPSALTPQSDTDKKPVEKSVADKWDFRPIKKYSPESAPAYSDLVKPLVFPVVSMCLYSSNANRCQCYSQQATKVDIDFAQCKDYALHGHFNQYAKERT